jgi:hypothetical protein
VNRVRVRTFRAQLICDLQLTGGQSGQVDHSMVDITALYVISEPER